MRDVDERSQGGRRMSDRGHRIFERIGRRRIVFWVVVMLALTPLIAAQWWLTRQTEAAMSAWRVDAAKDAVLRRQAYQLVKLRFDAAIGIGGREPTREDAAKLLNG